jgi:ATP adenylyltransferase
MDRLWTPWRLAFVEQGAGGPRATDGGSGERPACFLCAKPADSLGADRENLVLFRGQWAYVLLNLFPYNSGHLMVAPYAHQGDLPALPEADAAELFALVRRAVAVLREEYHPEGFNVGMNLGQVAGAGVPDHLHLHVVPRWSGDTNFMPVLGDTKVLPETLAQTYDRLRPRFGAASDPAAS